MVGSVVWDTAEETTEAEFRLIVYPADQQGNDDDGDDGSDASVTKVVYLAIEAASKRWSMPIRNWKAALKRFMIEFPERMPETS